MPAYAPAPTRRRRTALSTLAATLVTTALAPGLAHASNTDSTNPLVGQRQFLNCEEGHQSDQAWNPWAQANRTGGSQKALLLKVAKVPTVKWFAGTPTDKIGRRMERYLADVDHPQYGGAGCSTFMAGRYSAAQWATGPVSSPVRDPYSGSYPILAIRAMQYDHCAGATNPEASYAPYKPWIDQFVAQLGRTYDASAPYHYWDKYPAPGTHWRLFGQRQAAVILEPDALGRLGARSNCYTPTGKRKVLALMRYAVDRLTSLPDVAVYIDAGEDNWLSVGEAVRLLKAAGVAKARGFALNSTHFGTTKVNIRYGDKIAKRLHKHYVVNTAENAHGKLRERVWSHRSKLIPIPGPNNTNCNPPNAGLGTQPTTHTGRYWVDAYLYISRAGLSSNNHNRCGRGPADNVWYQAQALREAAQASFAAPNWPPKPL